MDNRRVKNPYTGRMINVGGLMFRKINKRLKDDGWMTQERVINPFTHRYIKWGGATYRRVRKTLIADGYVENPRTMNAKTGRKILVGGQTERRLRREEQRMADEEYERHERELNEPIGPEVFDQEKWGAWAIMYTKADDREVGFHYIERNGVLYRKVKPTPVTVFDERIVEFSDRAIYSSDEAFGDLVEILRHDWRFNDTWNMVTQSQDIDLIIVKDVVKMADDDGDYDPKRVVNHCDGNMRVYNEFINYTKNDSAATFGELFHEERSPYVVENFRPASCFVNVIVDTWHDAIENMKRKKDGKRRYRELTYDSVCEILNIPEERRHRDMGLSVIDVMPFFETTRLGLDVMTPLRQLLFHYRHENPNSTLKPSVLRCMVHDQHVYKLNDNIDEFEKTKERMGDELRQFRPSNRYRLREPEEFEIEYVDSLDAILNIVKKPYDKATTLRFIYNGDMYSLMADMIEVHHYYPRVRMTTHSKVMELGFKCGNVNGIIRGADNAELPEADLRFQSKEQYQKYTAAEVLFHSRVMKEELLSEYHPTVIDIERQFPRRALTAMFHPYEFCDINAVDMRKAYSTDMRCIERVPVFGYFDIYKQYDGHDIEDYTMYIVDAEMPTGSSCILLPERFHRCFGFKLKKCIGFRVLCYKRPWKIVDVNFRDAIDEVYASDLGNQSLNKIIVNRTTGLYEKSENHSVFTALFKKRDEATYYARQFGGEVMNIWRETEDDVKKIDYYMMTLEKRAALVNGFKYIKEMIYDIQAMKMAEVYDKLEAAGIRPMGIKTDAMLVDATFEQLHGLFDWTNAMGCFKFEEGKHVPTTRFEFKMNAPPYMQASTVSEHDVNDEFKDDETCAVFEKFNRVLVKGCAGSGKTTSVKRFCADVLFVAPTNRLCQGLRLDGFQAITVHKLMGLTANDEQLKKHKPVDVSEVKVICFDEIYLNSMRMLARIDKFITGHPDIKFLATGCNHQLTPFDNDLDGCEPMKYMQRAVNMTFPHQITLKINKRLKSEDDRKRMKSLESDIFDMEKDVMDTLKRHGVKIIHEMGEVNTLKNICLFNFRTDQVNAYVHGHLVKDQDGVVINGVKYWKGMTLVCRKHYAKTNGFRLFVNYDFVIDHIDPKRLTIHDILENEPFDLPISALTYFKLPYAATCHSTQGWTIRERITVFDINTPYVDRNFIYTALTRTEFIDQIQVFEHPEDEVKKLEDSKKRQYLRLKIEGYKNQDRIANRPFDDAEYVTVYRILSMLEKLHYMCPKCGDKLRMEENNGKVTSNVTVQRRSNARAHLSRNCSILCVECNRALK